MAQLRNLAVLGSTGSIGKNTLEVARAIPGLNVFGISGHRNLDLLTEQARAFVPQRVVLAERCPEHWNPPTAEALTRWQFGAEHLDDLASDDQVDIVVAGIVGKAGLSSTLAAARSGKRIALANKESLAVAGELFSRLVLESGAEVIPVDSEHCAIWQAATAGKRSEIRRVILTASGGPFLNYDEEQLRHVTVENALNHPNWRMGAKNSVDSATLMNKALEIIEARWLFDLRPDQICVMIHPQSIIHSMVEFDDGSVMAQMGPPDMKLPIQYALTYPNRFPGPAAKTDWGQPQALELSPPNAIQNEALQLGFRVCESGGTSGAVLNAANEVAVEAFLENQIPFRDIIPSVREVLEQHQTINSPTYEQLLVADAWAREELRQWILK